MRRPGGIPTRGLEALSAGCAVIVQRGSSLCLFAGEDEGVRTYDYQANDIGETVKNILSNWKTVERQALEGAKIIRREFSLANVSAQYLRYLTFLAAKPRPAREQASALIPLRQKRLNLWKCGYPGDLLVLQELRKANLQRWQLSAKRNVDLLELIDMLRELVIEYASTTYPPAHPPIQIHPLPQIMIHEILVRYNSGIRLFPRSLVLRLNMIRTAFHFASPEDVAFALHLAEETLLQPLSTWQIDFMEDVFPWDFFSNYFDYRSYFDELTRLLASRGGNVNRLKCLLLASLRFYIGNYSDPIHHWRQAVELNPEFPFYRFHYALSLINSNIPENLETAAQLLWELANNSILAKEALRLLEKLDNHFKINNREFIELKTRTESYLRQTGDLSGEKWELVELQPCAPKASPPSFEEVDIKKPFPQHVLPDIREMNRTILIDFRFKQKLDQLLSSTPSRPIFLCGYKTLQHSFNKFLKTHNYHVAGLLDKLPSLKANAMEPCGQRPGVPPPTTSLPLFIGLSFDPESIRKKFDECGLKDSEDYFLPDIYLRHRKMSFEQAARIMLNRCVDQQWRSIVLYGSGKHTRHLIDFMRSDNRSPHVECIVDDNPLLKSIHAIPVVPPNELSKRQFEAVVISSDAYEYQLIENVRKWNISCPVLQMYNSIYAQLVIEDYKGFNLYEAEDHFYAKKVRMEFTDIATASIRKIKKLAIAGKYCEAPDLEELKKKVNALAAIWIKPFLNRLAENSWRRIVLYGGGRFTARLLSIIDEAPKELQVVCIVDDNPKSENIAGKPIISPERLRDFTFDCVVASSDAHESQLIENARKWHGINCPLIGFATSETYYLNR